MSKFGELIDLNIPVLLDFYTEWNEDSVSMHPILRDVAAAVGDKGKIIKIDVKKGEMKWRQSGEQDANTLIGIMQEYAS